MATKNNPGPFPCYDHAAPDEPMFVLLGRDPTAFIVVAFWAYLRQSMGLNQAGDSQILDAEQTADALRAWADNLGKQPKTAQAQQTWDQLDLPYVVET